MGKHQNLIELNGKLYDASTGKMMQHKSHPSKPPIHGGYVIDGVVHRPKKHTSGLKVHVTEHHAQQPAGSHKAHQPAPHHKRKTEKPSTLARKAVNKPSLQSITTETEAPRLELSVPSASIIPKTDPTRLKRAQHVKMSSAISRFTFNSQSNDVEKRTAELPVRQAPEHNERAKQAKSTPRSKSEEQFTRAMNKSHAHEAQKAHRKPRKRLSHKLGISSRALSAGTVIFAGLLLIGFITYQNIPNLSMRVASSRAGFDAKLPGYQPSGFSLKGPIEYGSGYITLNFRSNSDDRNFHLTQKVSNWTSESLADNFLATNKQQYQTYQEKGKTIYIYGDNSATWVSGGVWYQVEGNSSLSNDQLLKIANSI